MYHLVHDRPKHRLQQYILLNVDQNFIREETSQVRLVTTTPQTAVLTHSSNHMVPVLSASSAILGICVYGKTAQRVLQFLTAGTCDVPSVASPRDCSDLNKDEDKSGVYKIFPDDGKAFKVYCDMTTDGGGWTVLTRRVDGSGNFVRKWKEYANGFGDLKREFWLGNEHMHRLTTKGRIELMVNLENFKNVKRFANYSTFKVGNAASKYILTVTGYRGDAGDAFSNQNGQKFTTADSGNDNYKINCALYSGRKGSGWWYNACDYVSFTLQYATNKGYSGEQLIQWQTWKGSEYSIKQATMKIRRS